MNSTMGRGSGQKVLVSLADGKLNVTFRIIILLRVLVPYASRVSHTSWSQCCRLLLHSEVIWFILAHATRIFCLPIRIRALALAIAPAALADLSTIELIAARGFD
jgi:hypothetical protein